MPSSFTANRFLLTLPPEEQVAVREATSLVHLGIGDVLYSVGDRFDALYFPQEAVVSLGNVLREGQSVEAATIGREGFTGLPFLLGNPQSWHKVVVEVPGSALRLPIDDVSLLGPHARRRAARYADCLLISMSQSAACIAVHPLLERCARWLLATADRTGKDTFSLTPEYLGAMLGVSRHGVTFATETLQQARLIDFKFDRVTIRRRNDLRDASCECYEVVESAYRTFLTEQLAPEQHLEVLR